ncbi:hypothetical protein NDU88_007870 [Pleurodeles waltl]|uniref:Uncharacterized protein n=1 Tax=Pleurodeles waltl TaxID=8319 RepID=A0AAV7RW40_PLEWA|nr:hypothetical protein NDU88_007870 [Pleurodeles waltl]
MPQNPDTGPQGERRKRRKLAQNPILSQFYPLSPLSLRTRIRVLWHHRQKISGKEPPCDGSPRSDPHSARTCADSALVPPEVTPDDCAIIGCVPRPRNLSDFKSRFPLCWDGHDRNRSWEASELVNLEEQTFGETIGTRTEETTPRRSGTPPESETARSLRTGAEPGS